MAEKQLKLILLFVHFEGKTVHMEWNAEKPENQKAKIILKTLRYSAIEIGSCARLRDVIKMARFHDSQTD